MASVSTNRVVLFTGAAAIAISAGFLGFHEFSGASAQPKASAVQIPVVPVSVETIIPTETRVWSEFSGRLNAVDYAEIRPELSGRITEVRFRDGQIVRAGEILYVIDPRPFEAALAKADANLASARTNADYAQTELDRATTLIKSSAIAQRQYDERANAKRVADAAVQAAEAELMQAKIDIDLSRAAQDITTGGAKVGTERTGECSSAGTGDRLAGCDIGTCEGKRVEEKSVRDIASDRSPISARSEIRPAKTIIQSVKRGCKLIYDIDWQPRHRRDNPRRLPA